MTKKSGKKKSQGELLFRNNLSQLLGMSGTVEHPYCVELYELVKRFHKDVQLLNKRHGVRVVDYVSFEVKQTKTTKED